MKIQEQKKHEYHKKNPWREDEENRLNRKGSRKLKRMKGMEKEVNIFQKRTKNL